MSALERDFVDHVSAHAGPCVPDMERAARVVLRALGGRLAPPLAAFVAAELPPAVGGALREGAKPRRRGTRVEVRVQRALHVGRGAARELIASVCHVLKESLSTEALAQLRAALADPAASFLDAAPAAAPRLHAAGTLADGRPGSGHPLCTERPADRAQRDSVAASAEPHADTKLSSARGATQEREHETLATGRPGSPRPFAGG